jgi:hypothetical protein
MIDKKILNIKKRGIMPPNLSFLGQVVRLLTQGELTGGEVEAVWNQVIHHKGLISKKNNVKIYLYVTSTF